MDRVVYIDNDYGTKDRYVIRKQYEGFGVYNRMTPTGYFVHQDWLITDGTVMLVVPSYARMCKDDLLDMIDHFNASGQFGVKALKQGGKYIAHLAGNFV